MPRPSKFSQVQGRILDGIREGLTETDAVKRLTDPSLCYDSYRRWKRARPALVVAVARARRVGERRMLAAAGARRKAIQRELEAKKHDTQGRDGRPAEAGECPSVL